MLRAFALALALLVGCSTVRSPIPLGDPIEDLRADDWAGRYFISDGEVVLEVDYGEGGALQVQFFERQDADGSWSADRSAPVLIRSLESDDFDTEEASLILVHFPDEQGTLDGPYDLMLLQKLDGQLVVWIPDVDHVARLVTEGALPGEVMNEGGVVRVLLGELSREEVATKMETSLSAFFDINHPLALVRLPDSLVHPDVLTALREASLKADQENK